LVLLNTTLFLLAFRSPGIGAFPVFCGTFFFRLLNVVCSPGFRNFGTPFLTPPLGAGLAFNVVDVEKSAAVCGKGVRARGRREVATGREVERHLQQFADAMMRLEKLNGELRMIILTFTPRMITKVEGPEIPGGRFTFYCQEAAALPKAALQNLSLELELFIYQSLQVAYHLPYKLSLLTASNV